MVPLNAYNIHRRLSNSRHNIEHCYNVNLSITAFIKLHFTELCIELLFFAILTVLKFLIYAGVMQPGEQNGQTERGGTRKKKSLIFVSISMLASEMDRLASAMLVKAVRTYIAS